MTNYSINYFLYKNYYDFYDAEKTVKDLISSVENKFVSRGRVKVQGSVELMLIVSPQKKPNNLLSLKVEELG